MSSGFFGGDFLSPIISAKPMATPLDMAKDPLELAFEAELRARLKKFRKKLGLTQEQVCGRAGIKLDNYKKYESREGSALPPHLFQRVALALEVSIAKLLTGHDEN